MSAPSSNGLTSIIVPCCNQRGFTQLCLQALFRHTRPAWELIVVDNGSTDGTRRYLEGVRDAAPVPVTLIANRQNLGFPRAINQGLRAARGEYLVLLNNDAVVTEGWLDQLIALSRAAASDVVGETGAPAAGGDDEARDAPKAGLRRRELCQARLRSGSAWSGRCRTTPRRRNWSRTCPIATWTRCTPSPARWRDEHRGQWFTAAKLSGFCLLMTRAVYDAVGGLDERFGLGFFDDDDLAVRARRAGFELAVAHDLFVHHFGSRTFAGNRDRCRRAAGGECAAVRREVGADVPRGPAGRVAAVGHADRRGGGGSKIPDSRFNGIEVPAGQDGRGGAGDGPRHCARVSLTMIVRDEEKNLPQVPRVGARGLRRDRRRGYRQRRPHPRDRPRVRGEGLRLRLGRRFRRGAQRGAGARHGRLRLLAGCRRRHRAGPSGEKLRLPAARRACGSSRRGRAGRLRGPVRLRPGRGRQRRRDRGRPHPALPRPRDDPLDYRVHEQILPALRRANVPVRWTDLMVRHTGYSDPALRARKLGARRPHPPRRAGRAAR